MFAVNQIVKGQKAGTFIVLGLRTIGGEPGAQVKPVNPDDHTDIGAGEFFLPIDALVAFPAIDRAAIQAVAKDQGIGELDAITLMQAGAAKIGNEEALDELCAIKAEILGL